MHGAMAVESKPVYIVGIAVIKVCSFGRNLVGSVWSHSRESLYRLQRVAVKQNCAGTVSAYAHLSLGGYFHAVYHIAHILNMCYRSKSVGRVVHKETIVFRGYKKTFA